MLLSLWALSLNTKYVHVSKGPLCQMDRTMPKRVFGHMQVWPRSACASAQGLHCPVTESLDTTKCIYGEQTTGWYFVCAQYDLNLLILCMFEGSVSLDAAYMKKNLATQSRPSLRHKYILSSHWIFNGQRRPWSDRNNVQMVWTFVARIKHKNPYLYLRIILVRSI